MPAERTDLVLLTTTRREFEAATIAEALHSHRVTAEVVHTPSDGPGRGASSPVEHRVMVPAGELSRARELLKFIEAQSMHLSWAQPPAASSSPPLSEARASPARGESPPTPQSAPAAEARHSEPAAGSKRVPLIVALAVIAAFVVIVLAIMGRPGS